MSDQEKFYEHEEDARSESSHKTNNEDPLDTLRKIDKKEKMKELKKMMYKLKEIQKTINIAKQESEEILEQMDFDKKDIKRIIDFVGEMSDVKLNNKEQRDIEEKIRKWLSGEEEEKDEKNGSSRRIDGPSVPPVPYSPLRTSGTIPSNWDLTYTSDGVSRMSDSLGAEINLSHNESGNTVLTDHDGNMLDLK